MRLRLHCVLIILSFAFLAESYDLFEGNDFGARMSYKEVKKHGLLLVRRTKTVSYIYPMGTKITGIACTDLTPNKTSDIKIVKGGLNENFIELEMTSARGSGLKYIIEIYTTTIKTDNNNN